MLGRWPVGSYEEQEESRGGRCTEATLGLLQICENGCEVEDQKREEGIEKLNSEERAGWHELQAVKYRHLWNTSSHMKFAIALHFDIGYILAKLRKIC